MASALSMLPRVHHTATLANAAGRSATVVVAGGMGMARGSQRAVDLFEIATETWRRGPKLLGGRYRHHAQVDEDGCVVVFGGEIRRGLEIDTPTPYAERLDDDLAQWIAIPARPLASGGKMPAPPRPGAAMCRLADGRLLAVGGLLDAKSSRFVDVYDQVGNGWEPIRELSHERAHAAAVELPDGSVLVLGGHAHDGSEDKLVASIERLRF